MTTLSVPLADPVARALAERAASAGKSVEDYAGDLLARAASLSTVGALAERNATVVREAGYSTEREVERAIHEGIKEVRRGRK